MSDPDPTRVARRAKILAHKYLPQYDWSLWIDANYRITGDIAPFVIEHLAKGTFFSFRQYKRACAYEEPEACIRHGKDNPAVLRAHAERYRRLGMPEGLPVPCTLIVLRRHNDPDVASLMEAWWRELQLGSRRDQVSLPYVLWKHPSPFSFFYDGLLPHYKELPFLTRTPHRLADSHPWELN